MSLPKVKTADGRPTGLKSLNIGSAQIAASGSRGLLARLLAAYRNLNLLMAGMYTGVGCAGTPHSEHSYSDEDSHSNDDKHGKV